MEQHMHICLNGHCKFSAHHIDSKEFCEECGAQMIDRCQWCGSTIKEWVLRDVVIVGEIQYQRPAYCRKCGNPYPWTQSAIKAATEIIEEEASFDKEQKEKLISSIPDVLAETPRSKLAAIRFKNAMAKAGKVTGEVIRQFMLDFGCQLVKDILGL